MISGERVMTSNPYFVSYVERVQESLAVFSMSDTDAANYVTLSETSKTYKPKFLIFETLFNYRCEENGKTIIGRRFDPQVSDKLLDAHQPESFLEDLKRLYENAEYLGLDWQSVRWASRESDKLGLSDLGKEMKLLSEIYNTKVLHLKPGELPPERDLQEIKRIIRKLIQRYEVEYIPINFGASAIIYEAWKLGKLFPLGDPQEDRKRFFNVLNGLFIQENRIRANSLFLEISQNLGLDHLTELESSQLKNGKTWTRKFSDDPHHCWFACVEQSLIHKTLKYSKYQRQDIFDRYLIHYPLVIDTYWFAGFAYLYAKDDSRTVANTLQKKPEIFDKNKYCKIYNVIQTVSETLKLSLRFDALSRVEERLKQQLSFEDLFLETVKDYFVCFNVSKTGEKANTSPTNNTLVYCNYGIDIYAPEWLSNKHKKLIRQELDGEMQVVGVRIPSLYEELQAKKRETEKIQMRGREEQSRQIAHQAAGLVAEVWDDPVRRQLEPRKKASLWQLKSLVDVWGNFNLNPDKNISDEPDPDFPEWETLTNKKVFQELIDISLCHALRRATYTRTLEEVTDAKTKEADLKTVNRAIEIMNLKDPIAVFRDEVFGAATEETIEWIDRECPSWLRYRGFVICFHHCFWQAAYHAFRAKCAAQRSPYLRIQVNQKQVIIKNKKEFNKKPYGEQPRDVIFFDSLTKRMQGFFDITGPEMKDDFWHTIITKNESL